MEESETSFAYPCTEEKPYFVCPRGSCASQFKYRKVSKLIKHFKREHPSKWFLNCNQCKFFVCISRKTMTKHRSRDCFPEADANRSCSCHSSCQLEKEAFKNFKFPLLYCCTHCSFSSDSMVDFNSHVVVHHLNVSLNSETQGSGIEFNEEEFVSSTNNNLMPVKPESQLEDDDTANTSFSTTRKKNEDPLDRLTQLSDSELNNSEVTSRQIHPCPVCGKCFTRQRAIKIHMVVHTDERHFTCNVCSYKARRLSDLNTHIKKVHNHERPYVCSECSKPFGFKTNLTRHMRIHRGEKPFACKFCDDTFRYKDSLKKHCVTFHSISN